MAETDNSHDYDYVVVGSGAGGGPVAANLAKASFRVLLLEAGNDDEPYDYKVPAFHSLSAENSDLAWKFYVQHYADPQRQRRDSLNFLDRQVVDDEERTGIFYPRAGTLGGCTAHNALIFVAPHNSDWDYIAGITGDASWKAARMRKYFQRVERCDYRKRPWSRWLNSARHGFYGWLPISTADSTLLLRDSVLVRLLTAAAQTCFDSDVWFTPRLWQRLRSAIDSFFNPSDLRQIGLARGAVSWITALLDPNDWARVRNRGEGLAFTPVTISEGVRRGTRELIRETSQQHPGKLTVKLHALVTKVLIEDGRAIGVEYFDGERLYRAHPHPSKVAEPERHEVKVRREVILAGGAFNTPQLLMLSGIGPPEHLKDKGIKVVVPLPGVGKNLQDRYEIGVVHELKHDLAILEGATLTPNDDHFTEWENGYGLYTTNGVLAAIIKRSSASQPDPDLFIFAIPGHFSGYRPGYSELGRKHNFFTWLVLKGHTNNTAGEVLLKSDDPREPPDINFYYFDEGSDPHGDDLDGVVAGVEFARKIAQRSASVFDEIIPGPAVASRIDLGQFVKDGAWGHHACGTCRIGGDSDGDAVLDNNFCVRGVKGLRVVDASIFPKIPGLFILSAVYMVAEKASDAIIRAGRRNDPPARTGR